VRADEPTNLASAFHLAGFRHVVATLWPLTDTAAAQAAQAFYDTVGEAPTADDTAHTVRAVARELRNRHPHRPDLWAALIHSGP
jgi:CHAT domain-containing protein